MSPTIRSCPDCGVDQPFLQVHDDADGCQDGLDGSCPEWYCAGCGAAFVIGFVPARAEARMRCVAELPGRVA